MLPTARLDLSGITKRFPGVLANDKVSFSVKPGEIHALLGENGAGKSTLVKMIYGIMQPDAGEIRWNGQRITIANPKAARRLGIGMVFQHFSLFEAMTVLENIALGMDGKIPQRELEAKILAVMAQYGLGAARPTVSTSSSLERSPASGTGLPGARRRCPRGHGARQPDSMCAITHRPPARSAEPTQAWTRSPRHRGPEALARLMAPRLKKEAFSVPLVV